MTAVRWKTRWVSFEADGSQSELNLEVQRAVCMVSVGVNIQYPGREWDKTKWRVV